MSSASRGRNLQIDGKIAARGCLHGMRPARFTREKADKIVEQANFAGINEAIVPIGKAHTRSRKDQGKSRRGSRVWHFCASRAPGALPHCDRARTRPRGRVISFGIRSDWPPTAQVEKAAHPRTLSRMV
jgi:hypothetical protein